MTIHKMMKQYVRVIVNIKDRRRGDRFQIVVTPFRAIGWLLNDVRIRNFTSVVMYDVKYDVYAPSYLMNPFVSNSITLDDHTRSLHHFA